MSDLGNMRIKYAADMSDLMSSQAVVDKSLKGIGDTGNQVSAKLQSAYAKVGEATKRMELAQTQAALAMQKAQLAAHDDSLSLEQVQVAMARADLAAERVTTSQASVAAVMERAGQVARQEAMAVTQVAETSERAGMSLRESFSGGLNMVSEAGGGFMGRMRGMVGGLLDFGSKLGMTIFGLQMFTQIAEQVGGALIGQNASMEQTTVAFKQLLGSSSAANAELKDLQQFAAETPFEFPELADATQKLLAFQYPLKETKPLLTAIGDALSGLGANTAANLDQVVHVFGQMHSTTHLMTGDLMQLTSVGINGFQILADQMHKPVSVIRDMVEKGLIPANDGIEMLRKGMEKTFGPGMQAQSQTFNGLLSTFQDNIGAAWRAFTGPLFEQAKGALTTLGNLVSSKGFQDFATTVGQKIGGALKIAADAIGAVIAAIKSPEFAGLGKTLGEIFGPLVDAISGPFKQAMQALSGANTSDITSNLRQAAQAAKIFLEALQGFKDGSSQFEQAGTNIRDMAIQVGGALKQVSDFLVSTFTPDWIQLKDTINYQIIPSWYSLKNAIGQVSPELRDLAGGAVVIVAAIVQSFARLLGQAIEAAGGVVQAFTGAFEIIAAHAAIFVDLMNGDFGRVGENLPTIWDGIKLLIIGALNSLNLVFFGFIDGILALFGTSLPKLTSQWLNSGDQMKASSNDMSKKIQASFASMDTNSLSSVQTLSDSASRLFQQLNQNAQGQMASLDQATINYWNDIAAYIDNKSALAADAANRNFARIHNPGLSANIYNKNFATGGDIPTTGVYTVGEQGPEKVVLPGGAHVYPHGVEPGGYSSSPAPLQGVGKPPVIENHTHIYLDSQEIAHYAGDQQARMVRLHQARRAA